MKINIARVATGCLNAKQVMFLNAGVLVLSLVKKKNKSLKTTMEIVYAAIAWPD